MKKVKLDSSKQMYLILVLIIIILQIILAIFLLPPNQIISNWLLIIIYVILGYIALRFFEKNAGFPEMIDKVINFKERFLIP